MTLTECLDLIKSFSKEKITFGSQKNVLIFSSLEQEKNIKFPSEFKDYIDHFAPLKKCYFSKIGNPLEIYPVKNLSWLMDGYNFNSVTKKPIESWQQSWFIFADEGADPIIIKLDEQENQSKVYKAMHGAGEWTFYPIADSIAQFLVCAAAVHHALEGFDLDDPIEDDDDGFNLAEEPANWLFPFIKKHALPYYDEWLVDFENRSHIVNRQNS